MANDGSGSLTAKDNLERILININKFINIDGDRESYANNFGVLRNRLFQQLKKDDAFKYFLNGHQLGGSYGDNLKVKKPDEFDSVFHLKLPESKKCIIIKDKELPGNVHIDITNIMETIKNQKQHEQIYTLLKKWITSDNRLIVDRLQNWLQNLFKNALTQFENPFLINGSEYILNYKRSGPAHTIYVEGNYKYSVDFVPGILMNADQCILPKKQSENWEVIPKPLKPPKPNNTSFRASYYVQENKIIKNNLNLKNALRMLKKFRDSHQNMANLKSYFIKTLFLWKAEKCEPNYWRKPLSLVVVDMFTELETCLCMEKLPFYWNPNLNMFDTYKGKQKLSEMQKCVTSACKTLRKALTDMNEVLKYQTYCVFLTVNERRIAEILNPGITTNLIYAADDVSNPDNNMLESENKKWKCNLQ